MSFTRFRRQTRHLAKLRAPAQLRAPENSVVEDSTERPRGRAGPYCKACAVMRKRVKSARTAFANLGSQLHCLRRAATTNNHSHSTTAAMAVVQAAFGTTELHEMSLSHLPQADLARALRVSRAWNILVSESAQIHNPRMTNVTTVRLPRFEAGKFVMVTHPDDKPLALHSCFTKSFTLRHKSCFLQKSVTEHSEPNSLFFFSRQCSQHLAISTWDVSASHPHFQ